MPKFHLEVPHTLPSEEAQSRLQRLIEMELDQHKEKLSDLSHSWIGNTLQFAFKTFGFKVAGAVESLDQKVVVNGDIPIAAMMFKGKIESALRERLQRLLR